MRYLSLECDYNKIIDLIARTLHHSWYKETVEKSGAYGKPGECHGRFRASKDPELDYLFFFHTAFDDNDNSVKKDKNGNPYYKVGNAQFWVDTAIKGWDHLPPSWKKENIEAAQELYAHIIHYYQKGGDIAKDINLFGKMIHQDWVTREILKNFNVSRTQLKYVTTDGGFSKVDMDYITGVTREKVGASSLLGYLAKENKRTLSKLRKIYHIENLRAYNLLPFEEQIKDVNQVAYALAALAKNTDIPYFKEQFEKVEKVVNAMHARRSVYTSDDQK